MSSRPRRTGHEHARECAADSASVLASSRSRELDVTSQTQLMTGGNLHRKSGNTLFLNPLHRRSGERAGFPTCAGAFPFFGHMPAMSLDYLGFVRWAERELGHSFWVNTGFGMTTLYVTHEDAFSILKNKVTTSNYLQEGLLGDVFGISIFGQDGAVHHHMRSAMGRPFSVSGLTGSGIGNLFADVIERWLSGWPAQRELRILDETRNLVLSLLFRMMGIHEEEVSVWSRQYQDFFLLLINIPIDFPGAPRRRGTKAKAWLHERLLKMIGDARQRGGSDFLAMLANARDDDGQVLSDDELVDNLRILVLAGHETTASVIAWMVILLADDLDVWEKLSAEAAAMGRCPRAPAELRDFPVADAIFRETLRLYPPVYVNTRRATVDFELLGKTVPKGTNVTMPVMHLSRSADHYPQPDEFVPQRWLNKRQPLTPLEVIQFGGGPHFCLGYHTAHLEAVQFAVALAQVCRRSKVRPRLVNAKPKPRYLPLLHPPSGTRIRFA